jgi:hypothetical protein
MEELQQPAKEDTGKLTQKARLERLENRLEGVEQALGLRPSPPKLSYWRRKWNWISNNKGDSAVFLVILTVGGAFLAYWLEHRAEWQNKEIDGRINFVLSQPKGVQEALNNVQQTVQSVDASLKTLAPYIHDTVTKQFENAANLPPAVLQERLPAVKDLLAVAKDQNIRVGAPALDNFGPKAQRG